MEAHHWPSDIFELVVDTIPRLVKSKDSVIQFFESCGVPRVHLTEVKQRLAQNRDRITKYQMVRMVVGKLNDLGDVELRSRRDVLRRVVEWEDFAGSYANDREKAELNVHRLRKLTGTKDAVTKLKQDLETERLRVARERERKARIRREKEAARSALKERFASVFAEVNPQVRGKRLEGVLNEYFKLEGILVREDFCVVDPPTGMTLEQIDGAIELGGQLFLVEIKWWKEPLGAPEVGYFASKVWSHPDCGGLLIAHPGVTAPAYNQLREAIVRGRTVFQCTLQSLWQLLDAPGGETLATYLERRRRDAQLDKRP